MGGLPKKMNLKLIEPLKDFFKDEVRVLGKSLASQMRYLIDTFRSGLAIRIWGRVTLEKIKILLKKLIKF